METKMAKIVIVRETRVYITKVRMKTQANKMKEMQGNKNKHVRTTKRAQNMTLTAKIHHYCLLCLGKIPLGNL